MDWYVLGIEATTDRDAITRAYRAKLANANPEERPEEFKELRAAYEEALRLADEAEKPEEEKTPVQAWAAGLEGLYDDLSRRISPDAWREALSADVVCALDTAPEAEEALLVFLMDHYYLPQAIWQLLDERFSWTERADELKERFNADFITYAVLGGINSGEKLPLTLFAPGKDGQAADRYIRLYNKIDNSDRDEAKPLWEELQALPESHPYGTCAILRERIIDGDESAIGEMEELLAAYPGDDHLSLSLAAAYFNANRFPEAESLSRKVMEAETSTRAMRILAESLAAQGKYDDAVDVINDMMGLMDGNQKALWDLNEVRARFNEALITQYTEKLAAEPDDMQTIFDLAWCYIQNDRNEEAYPLAMRLAEGFPDPFGYYNLLAHVTNTAKEYDRSLDFMDKLIDVVRSLEPDGTDKTEKRRARLGEMLLRKAETLSRLDRDEEALAATEEALAAKPDDGEVLTFAMHNYARLGEFSQAAELADRLCKLAPYSYHGFLLKAIYNYELHNDGEAYKAVNDAIDLDPTDLMEYHMKLLLLTRNHLADDARNLIAFLKENGFTDDLTVDWCETRLDIDVEEHPETALPAWQAIEARVDALPNEEKPRWTPEFYYRLARLTADVKDAKEDYSRDDLLALLEKGLAARPNDDDCTEYKAWLLKKEERNEESIALFERLAAKPHRGLFPERNLAELYYRDLQHNAPSALKYYEMLLADDDEDGDLDFYAGMCLYRMGRLQEAEQHFLAEQRKAPDDIDGYYRLSYVYLAMNRLQEALEQGRKTINLAKKDSGDTSKFWHPAVCALRRMGLADAAVQTLRECRQFNTDNTCYKTMFETYMQFGLFDQAAALLKEWEKDKLGKKDVAGRGYATLLLNIMQGKYAKARQEKAWQYNNHLDEDDNATMEVLLQTELGKTAAALKVAKNVTMATQESGIDTHAINRFALALWADGQLESARKVSEQSLKELDRRLEGYSSFKPLYLTRKAQCLALLGRFPEAAEALREARSLPLCENCDYCTCKDADVMECRAVAMLGDFNQALQMIADCEKRWPGEEELPHLRNIIRAKMKNGR